MASRDQDLLEARRHLREAHIQITQARFLLQRHQVKTALGSIGHVEPWLATARREVHQFQRAADGG